MRARSPSAEHDPAGATSVPGRRSARSAAARRQAVGVGRRGRSSPPPRGACVALVQASAASSTQDDREHDRGEPARAEPAEERDRRRSWRAVPINASATGSIRTTRQAQRRRRAAISPARGRQAAGPRITAPNTRKVDRVEHLAALVDEVADLVRRAPAARTAPNTKPPTKAAMKPLPPSAEREPVRPEQRLPAASHLQPVRLDESSRSSARLAGRAPRAVPAGDPAHEAPTDLLQDRDAPPRPRSAIPPPLRRQRVRSRRAARKFRR